jgi:hypothetical protein
MELTTADIASVDAGYWACLNKIKLQTGAFSFTDHEYQIEPMSHNGRRKCYMKATQGGFTEIEILDDFHGMRYGRYPLGVLHLMPTTDDVNEFSKARFNPLIFANPRSIGRFVQSTDTASLKKIGEAFLYLRGAMLSRKIEEHSESTKLRSIPVDVAKFDELDLMDEEVKEKDKGRMGHSKVKKVVYISNPSIPDFGIDKVFQQSDQRHWFRKCTCGEFTCAELSFPECVKIRQDGTGYIGCNKCGKELGISPGEWVPSVRENTEYMQGYRWSQLTSVFNDPAEILEDYTNPPEGNLGDVIRLRLGLPYVAIEDKLRISDVLACCGNDIPYASHKGPCAMGLDVGKLKHLIIGGRIGKDRYQIYKTAIVSSWNDVHDLCKKFNVRSGVVDIRPYEDSARQFQKSEPYKIFLCEYKENTPQGTIYSNNTGIVSVNRTEIFDATHRLVTTNGQLIIPRLSPDIKEFAKQLCATAKVLETNKKTKLSVYRYKKLGNEHFRNALNYFYLAASGGKVASIQSAGRHRQRVALNNYQRC